MLGGLKTLSHRPIYWGHFIEHSPRAGRGSGLATIARGVTASQIKGRGRRAGYLPKSAVSASAFSSQYVMPMSRYIAVAVARCSRPWSLPRPRWQWATGRTRMPVHRHGSGWIGTNLEPVLSLPRAPRSSCTRLDRLHYAFHHGLADLEPHVRPDAGREAAVEPGPDASVGNLVGKGRHVGPPVGDTRGRRACDRDFRDVNGSEHCLDDTGDADLSPAERRAAPRAQPACFCATSPTRMQTAESRTPGRLSSCELDVSARLGGLNY